MSGPPGSVRVEALSKTYPRTLGPFEALRALARGSLPSAALEHGGRRALDGVGFALEPGAALGVIGRNGSGKTTLLRVLAGGMQPSAGRVRLAGRCAALIDLGAGIDPAFSGRENAVLLSVLAGASRREALRRIDAVHEFSGLGDAFEEPVRRYSSGMTLRLAFSAAIAAEPQVLLVDEVLAVGDAFFQQRCLLRVRRLQETGCTTVIVSHDPAVITGFCDRALWLEAGRVACSGEPGRVVREYLASGLPVAPARGADAGAGETSADRAGGAGAVDAPIEPPHDLPNVDHRAGDGRARVTGMALRDEAGRPLEAPRPGEPLRVVISVCARTRIAHPVVGFTLRNRLGEILSATNTAHAGHALPALGAGGSLCVEFALRWPPLASGAFSLSPAVADGGLEQHTMNDWVDNALVFEVHNPDARYGWMALEGVRVRSSCEASAAEAPAEGRAHFPAARAGLRDG